MTAPLAQMLDGMNARARRVEPLVPTGRVCSLVGTVIEAEGVRAGVGSLHEIRTSAAGISWPAEVVGFRGARTLLMPLADADGLSPGALVRPLIETRGRIDASGALGRVVDGLGRPLDGGPALPRRNDGGSRPRRVSSLRRRPIEQPLDVGVGALNSLLTVGRGTRIGLFAAAGVGKSTLLGQIARFTQADCFVIGLVGERGREVREFVERELGDALSRAIVVVATSDEAPVMRRRAAELATSLAEELRAQQRDVLLLIDSLTRVCTAQREIGLAAGEPPATRGYPPSVWSALPRLLERAGTNEGPGSVTGIYTVLVEGDDHDEPVADAARSLLDGHVVLSRRLADRGRYPAIDVLASVSRAMPQVVDEEAVRLAQRAREVLANHVEAEELVEIGAYQPGSDARFDEALRLGPALHRVLAQSAAESRTLEESRDGLRAALEGASS